MGGIITSGISHVMRIISPIYCGFSVIVGCHAWIVRIFLKLAGMYGVRLVEASIRYDVINACVWLDVGSKSACHVGSNYWIVTSHHMLGQADGSHDWHPNEWLYVLFFDMPMEVWGSLEVLRSRMLPHIVVTCCAKGV